MSAFSSEESNLVASMQEAERFLARANTLLPILQAGGYGAMQTPARAAARRASLDLTKSLAEFRRGAHQ